MVRQINKRVYKDFYNRNTYFHIFKIVFHSQKIPLRDVAAANIFRGWSFRVLSLRNVIIVENNFVDHHLELKQLVVYISQ